MGNTFLLLMPLLMLMLMFFAGAGANAIVDRLVANLHFADKPI